MRIHNCKLLCSKPPLNGVKKFYAMSMYLLKYCRCDTCDLFFKPDAQRNKDSGYVRNCRCCGDRLRFSPTHAGIACKDTSRAHRALKDDRRY